MIKVIGEMYDVESLEVVDELRMKELKMLRTRRCAQISDIN